MRRIFPILLLTSCISTEDLNTPEVEQVDTVRMYRQPPKEEPDTSRVPIGFNPSVEDWEENDVDLSGVN